MALDALQRMFGQFPRIMGKGDYASVTAFHPTPQRSMLTPPAEASQLAHEASPGSTGDLCRRKRADRIL